MAWELPHPYKVDIAAWYLCMMPKAPEKEVHEYATTIYDGIREGKAGGSAQADTPEAAQEAAQADTPAVALEETPGAASAAPQEEARPPAPAPQVAALAAL